MYTHRLNPTFPIVQTYERDVETFSQCNTNGNIEQILNGLDLMSLYQQKSADSLLVNVVLLHPIQNTYCDRDAIKCSEEVCAPILDLSKETFRERLEHLMQRCRAGREHIKMYQVCDTLWKIAKDLQLLPQPTLQEYINYIHNYINELCDFLKKEKGALECHDLAKIAEAIAIFGVYHSPQKSLLRIIKAKIQDKAHHFSELELPMITRMLRLLELKQQERNRLLSKIAKRTKDKIRNFSLYALEQVVDHFKAMKYCDKKFLILCHRKIEHLKAQEMLMKKRSS